MNKLNKQTNKLNKLIVFFLKLNNNNNNNNNIAPEYSSKLFLDCCGLIRRVMRDLEEDFGFRIGNGNQAYMFDTLPNKIENLDDVRPGDLVFITAVYYSPKSMLEQNEKFSSLSLLFSLLNPFVSFQFRQEDRKREKERFKKKKKNKLKT